jgi:Ni/Fe-hydrogenase 1 B-type cytochrome subunit
MAYFTYAGTGLLTIFQVVSGYALYAPMSEAWFPALFTWATPLFGSEATMRMFHYAVMWAFGIFTLVHVYLVFYHDYVEGHGVLSSMVGGWKFMEKKHAEAELATGISPAPATRPTTPVAPVRPAKSG